MSKLAISKKAIINFLRADELLVAEKRTIFFMGLRDQLNQEYGEALKRKDERVVSVIRLLKSAVKNQEIESRHELTEEELHAVVRRLIKQSQDARADFVRGGRADLVSQTDSEIAQLEKYVPALMSEEDLVGIIDSAIKNTNAQSAGDIGKVMGAVMKQTAGRADGTVVRALALKRLS